jgi:hypothetical protein
MHEIPYQEDVLKKGLMNIKNKNGSTMHRGLMNLPGKMDTQNFGYLCTTVK